MSHLLPICLISSPFLLGSGIELLGSKQSKIHTSNFSFPFCGFACHKWYVCVRVTEQPPIANMTIVFVEVDEPMDDAPENGVGAAAFAGDDDEVVGDIDEHEVGHCTAVSRFFPTPCPPKLTKVLTTAGYSIRYRHMFQISFRRRIGPIGGSAEGLRSLDDLLTLLKHLPPHDAPPILL